MNGFDFSTATDIRLGSSTITALYYGSTKLWPSSQPSHDYSQDYLTFEALEAGTFTWTDTTNSNSISYSTDDGSTWTTLASGSSTPVIAANNKVMFKASGLSVGDSGIGTFSSTGTFDAMGNIMSLVYGDNFANQTTINNNYQFYSLFMSSRMVDASNLILPATTLAALCYAHMFSGCTSLTTAPELPATSLTILCYSNMFYNCTSLTTAPELPATILATYCYQYMFHDCTSLTTAPEELPATSLSMYCYYYMFSGCTNLTTAPELPATKLANFCYDNMFDGCSKLNSITCLATTMALSGGTFNWVNGVAASGTFAKDALTSWTTGASGIPSGWTVVSLPHDYSQDYLTFEALEDGTFTWTDTTNNNTIYYSTNNGLTWSGLTSGSSTRVVTANNKVLFRVFNQSVGSTGIGTFSSTGSFNAMGNIMSLVYGDNFDNQTAINNNYQFYSLFKNSRIVDASNLILPATSLTDTCYREMFQGCTSLTAAPELPATTLANNCYRSMFFGCTSLTAAPELPATTLAISCYNGMFSGCTSLAAAPELTATTLANYCYQNMFFGCTSLTTAPELPATTLTSYCYCYMFYGCTNLSSITCLATNISPSTSTTNWVNGVAASGTFVKAASMTRWTTGNNGIPSGWTVQDAS